MAMRHIKNTSPNRIPITLSVMRPDKSTLTVELQYGESILVNDTGSATNSVIIQVKKGNITMSDEFPETMVPYEKCIISENINDEIDSEEISKIESSEEILSQDEISGPEIVQEVAAQSNEVIKKAGRPKGSTKKKRGRPKGTTKKKKLKTIKKIEQQNNSAEQNEQQ